MSDLGFYDVVNCAGVGAGMRAASADAARLKKLDQIIEGLELAEKQGKPRRFDWRCLPKTAVEFTGYAATASDLYPAAT